MRSCATTSTTMPMCIAACIIFLSVRPKNTKPDDVRHRSSSMPPINDKGELILEELEQLLGPRTKIVAVGHVSNALGTINPVAQIVTLAHAKDIPVLVDGAQAVPRIPVDVQALGCDFYVFSGHKT